MWCGGLRCTVLQGQQRAKTSKVTQGFASKVKQARSCKRVLNTGVRMKVSSERQGVVGSDSERGESGES
eukprot:3110894-Amphidinium_carterae.1